MRPVLVLACLAGCHVALGLEHVDQAPADAARPRVTGRIWERYVENDTSFAPIARERVYPPSSIAFSVTLDDGTEPAITYRDDGSFEFERAAEDQPYRLVFSVDDVRAEYQLTSPDIAIPRFVAGRPRSATQSVSYLEFTYPAAAADLLGAHVATTGTHSFTYTGAFGAVTFDWRTASASGGSQLGMLDTRFNDRAYVLEMRVDRTSHPPLEYLVVTAASSAPVTLVPSQTHTLPAPSPAPRNACARMFVPNATALARIESANLRPHVYLGGDWHVFASPGPEVLAAAGTVTLASAGSMPTSDSEIAVTVHDPFPGWSLLGQAGALAGFDTLLPGTTTPLRLYDVTRRYRPIDHGPLDCSHPARDMASSVGIAGNITVAGTPIVSDAQSLALPDGPVEVTWEVASPGAVHHAAVSLHELIATGGFTTNIHRRVVQTVGTRALLDRSLFVSGGNYIVAVTLLSGRPGAADGDWSQLAEPFENSTSWSRYIVVQ